MKKTTYRNHHWLKRSEATDEVLRLIGLLRKAVVKPEGEATPAFLARSHWQMWCGRRRLSGE
ncbi:MAG: hypothetical protein HQK59_07240 [Deltaproteobacteria bacterium]|nr:hypothetical protein [Deltaproteobacteria bacterium]